MINWQVNGKGTEATGIGLRAAGGSRGRLIGDIQLSGFTHAMTSTEFHASLISGNLSSRKS